MDQLLSSRVFLFNLVTPITTDAEEPRVTRCEPVTVARTFGRAPRPLRRLRTGDTTGSIVGLPRRLAK